MDSSDAPTCAAVNRHLLDDQSDAGLVSLLTADIGEDEDFKRVAVLCGRDSEMEQIRAAYERASTGKSEAFLVHGVSGTGKSSLIESMREEATSRYGGYFVSGKFDQLVTGKAPFSAIAAAFSDICDLILQGGQLEDRRMAISAALGADSQLLSRVVSNINEVTTHGNCAAEDSTQGGLSLNSEDFTRFRLACQQFLRAVATEDHPLLIFLDDLQWADEMSLKLIKSLLKDSSSNHMLLCLAYRDDEMDGTEMLDLDDTKENGLPYTQVAVRNLDSGDLCSLLAQMLHIHDMPSLEPLTALILAKTKGNPNVVVQLLQHLKSKRLLKFSDETYNWVWEMNRIESEVSDNPTEIIAQKISSLDPGVREMLILAAYIGHIFDIELLHHILLKKKESQLNAHGTDGSLDASSDASLFKLAEMRNGLYSATVRGLIEQKGKGRYRFSHDTYQHYLYNSIADDLERQLMHLIIGRTLMSGNCGTDEGLILLAASNLTRGNPMENTIEDEERIAEMQLFLEAAELAASKVSLVDSKQYLLCALEMAKESDYSEHYELCVGLQNTYAEIQSCTGFFEDSNRAVDIVLLNARQLDDRFRAQCTRIRSLVYQQKNEKLFDWTFNVVLRQFGEYVPTRPSLVQLALELSRTKMALRKTKPEDFLTMPKMEDKEKCAVMEVFSILNPVLFLLPDKSLYLYTALRQIRLSVKYGISPFTSSSLASYALILTMRNQIDVAYRLGKVSVLIASREGHCLNAKALCMACTAMFIYPRKHRLVTLVDSLDASYQIGLSCGSDLAVAFYGLSGYLEARNHLGMPLVELEEKLKRYCVQMKEFQAHTILSYQLMLWQYVLNLLGQADDPLILTGEAMTEAEHLRLFKEEGDEIGLVLLSSYRLKLQISFEDWESAKGIVKVAGKGFDKAAGHFSHFFYATEIALASLAIYQSSKEKRYLRIAHRFSRRVRKWSQQDDIPDTVPLMALLDAEWTAAVGKDSAPAGLYDAAIEALKTSNFVAFETIAYQRAIHLALRQQNIRKAQHFLAISLKRHDEWGNVAKLEWLRSKFSHIQKRVRPAFVVEVRNDMSDRNDRCVGMHNR